MPRSAVKAFHRWDSNCLPRSVVTVDGVPKWEIHVCVKALATESAVQSVIGTASACRARRSGSVPIVVLL